MDIIIPLPQYSSTNTYKELMGYLKQLELAVHHAQKAVENAEETGIEITENAYVNFDHPALESSLTLDSRDEKTTPGDRKLLENFTDNYYEELQNIALNIHID